MRKNLLLYAVISGVLLVVFLVISLSTSQITCSTKKSIQKSNKVILEKIPLISTLNSELDIPAVSMPYSDFEMLFTDTKIEQNTTILTHWRYLTYQDFWLVKVSFFQQSPNEPGYTYTYMYCLNKKMVLTDKILVHSKYDANSKSNSYTEYHKSYIKNGYVLIEYKDITLTENKNEYMRCYKLSKTGKFEKIT
jgi:hypothetical protein